MAIYPCRYGPRGTSRRRTPGPQAGRRRVGSRITEPARRCNPRFGLLIRKSGTGDLQTTLSPAQEAVAVALRTTLLLPLDDLLAVVREFLSPPVSRSGLDRCMRRNGVGNLRELKAKEGKPTNSSFKSYQPTYLHIDIKYLPQMSHEDRRRNLFVAIEKATRWNLVRIYPTQTSVPSLTLPTCFP